MDRMDRSAMAPDGQDTLPVAGDMEFCAFVVHQQTDTRAAIWRDRDAKRIVVAFKGTSVPRDFLTDVKIIQTPWEALKDGESDNSDNPTIPRVHAGFREASDSVSRRLKELVIAAT